MIAGARRSSPMFNSNDYNMRRLDMRLEIQKDPDESWRHTIGARFGALRLEIIAGAQARLASFKERHPEPNATHCRYIAGEILRIDYMLKEAHGFADGTIPVNDPLEAEVTIRLSALQQRAPLPGDAKSE